MAAFGPGDTVVCVCDKDMPTEYTRPICMGHVYVVADVAYADSIYLVGYGGQSYWRRRFVLKEKKCTCPANAFRCTCQPT